MSTGDRSLVRDGNSCPLSFLSTGTSSVLNSAGFVFGSLAPHANWSGTDGTCNPTPPKTEAGRLLSCVGYLDYPEEGNPAA